MSLSDKIRGLLKSNRRKIGELADYFGISYPAMRNKLQRNSFSAFDLIKIAQFFDIKLQFEINEKQRIELTMDDVKKDK